MQLRSPAFEKVLAGHVPHTWSDVALQALAVNCPLPQPAEQVPVQGAKPVALNEVPTTHDWAQDPVVAVGVATYQPNVALQPHFAWPVALSGA